MNPASLPLLATALIAAAVAFTAVPAAGDKQPPEMVELEVAGVFPLDGGQAGMLVLREKGRETLLPIVVGRGEAEAIEMRLEHREATRPRVQDLLESTIGALGGRVVRVEIHDGSEALYRASVYLVQGSNRVQLDARPSDSVVLALGSEAPIFATKQLVEDSGLTREDLRRMNGSDEESSAHAPALPGIPGDQEM